MKRTQMRRSDYAYMFGSEMTSSGVLNAMTQQKEKPYFNLEKKRWKDILNFKSRELTISSSFVL